MSESDAKCSICGGTIYGRVRKHKGKPACSDCYLDKLWEFIRDIDKTEEQDKENQE